MGEYCKGYNKCLEDVVAVLQIYAREQVVSTNVPSLKRKLQSKNEIFRKTKETPQTRTNGE